MLNLSQEKSQKNLRIWFTCQATKDNSNYIDMWIVFVLCSNHMTGKSDLFADIDKSVKVHVKMGNDFVREVYGKGTGDVKIFDIKKIHDMHFLKIQSILFIEQK